MSLICLSVAFRLPFFLAFSARCFSEWRIFYLTVSSFDAILGKRDQRLGAMHMLALFLSLDRGLLAVWFQVPGLSGLKPFHVQTMPIWKKHVHKYGIYGHVIQFYDMSILRTWIQNVSKYNRFIDIFFLYVAGIDTLFWKDLIKLCVKIKVLLTNLVGAENS